MDSIVILKTSILQLQYDTRLSSIIGLIGILGCWLPVKSGPIMSGQGSLSSVKTSSSGTDIIHAWVSTSVLFNVETRVVCESFRRVNPSINISQSCPRTPRCYASYSINVELGTTHNWKLSFSRGLFQNVPCISRRSFPYEPSSLLWKASSQGKHKRARLFRDHSNSVLLLLTSLSPPSVDNYTLSRSIALSNSNPRWWSPSSRSTSPARNVFANSWKRWLDFLASPTLGSTRVRHYGPSQADQNHLKPRKSLRKIQMVDELRILDDKRVITVRAVLPSLAKSCRL